MLSLTTSTNIHNTIKTSNTTNARITLSLSALLLPLFIFCWNFNTTSASAAAPCRHPLSFPVSCPYPPTPLINIITLLAAARRAEDLEHEHHDACRNLFFYRISI
jgi:hypothetical protein